MVRFAFFHLIDMRYLFILLFSFSAQATSLMQPIKGEVTPLSKEEIAKAIKDYSATVKCDEDVCGDVSDKIRRKADLMGLRIAILQGKNSVKVDVTREILVEPIVPNFFNSLLD